MNNEKTESDVPETPSAVLGLLREQARLYGELESCASRQRSLVAGDQVGPLLAILSDREQLSGSLATIGRRLEPVRAQWDSFRTRFAASELREADQLLTVASTRLQNVIRGDEQDARVLYGRKQAVANALRSVHSTHQAMNAYRGAAAPTRSRVNEES